MGPITSLIPVPRRLRVARVDAAVYVSEMQLLDLAELQAVLDATWADPYLAIREALAATPEDSRWPILSEAYGVAEEGPPVYGEGVGGEYFNTLEGFSLLAWVSLRRNHPDLSPEDVATLVALMDEQERFHLRWIAEGGNALRTLGRMLLEGHPRPKPTPIPWGQAIHEVAEMLGVPYAHVYSMTLTEFRNARRGGKPEEISIPVPDGADLGAMMAMQQRRISGLNGSGD